MCRSSKKVTIQLASIWNIDGLLQDLNVLRYEECD